MKILHVIPAISAIYGGPSTAIYTIAKSVLQQGIKVDVVTTTADGKNNLDVPLGQRIEKENIGFYFFHRNINEWKFSWSLTKWLNNNISNYDIVHIHAIFCYPIWIASRIAKKYSIPYIIRPAGILDPWCIKQKAIKKKLYYHLIEKKTLQNASAIHVTSELEKSSLNNLGFYHNLHLIQHAVKETIDMCRKSPEEENEMRFLFLSRLDPKKGLSFLLDAMVIVVKSSPSIRLTIAGEGEPTYINNLLKKIKKLKLDNYIHLIGFVKDEKKHEVLKQHHVLVLPSLQENFALCVAEALATGMPVIVSDQVGLAKEIKKFAAGVVVPVAKTMLLAEAMLSFFAKQRWSLCSKNAINYANQKLTLNVLGKNLLELYETIMNKKKCL
jgi:glycosyltransferase involved in cell wall biosynthesis